MTILSLCLVLTPLNEKVKPHNNFLGSFQTVADAGSKSKHEQNIKKITLVTLERDNVI